MEKIEYVYSRSPISHRFTIVEADCEKDYIIAGTNTFGVVVFDDKTPKMTELPEGVFAKIKEKYKDHIKFFGGKTSDGVKQDPLMYLAKTSKEAEKQMRDAQPIITENEMATKTKGIVVSK